MSEQRIEDLSAVIEVGNEFFEPGLTHLVLNANGDIQVTTRFNDQEKGYRSQVAPETAARLLERIRDGMERDVRVGERLGLPDEPRYEIVLLRGGEQLRTVTVWRSELAEQPALQQAIGQLQELTEKMSDGQAIL